MQQTSFLSQLLLLMEKPLVVLAMTVATIVLRMLWLGYRKRWPQFAAGATRKIGTPAPKDAMLEIIDTLLIALILVFGIVRPFLLQTFYIPSGSMEPNLLKGDKLIANKFVLRFRPPQHGEIIVFEPPMVAVEGNDPWFILRRWLTENRGTLSAPELALIIQYKFRDQMGYDQHPPLNDAKWDEQFLLSNLPTLPEQREAFIKRVVGVPGDHIRVLPGKGVFINGVLQTEPYLPRTEPVGNAVQPYPHAEGVFPQLATDPGKLPRMADFTVPARGMADDGEASRAYFITFMDWLQGWYKYHYLYQARIEPNLDKKTHEFVVPPNSVFVMGDNRHDGGSFDSRYWGVVPVENVKARAVSTFWPLNRLKLL